MAASSLLEILVLVLAIATLVLGLLVRDLFQENTQLRSDLESRLVAIEQIKGPFARMLSDAGPAPLRRVLTLSIQLDAAFWKYVLRMTPAELEQTKDLATPDPRIGGTGPSQRLRQMLFRN